jgi:3',5'-cyclic AMP phosphodiesterase CpdA
MAMGFTVAHLSDLHLPLVGTPRIRLLLNKRVLGWLSWSRRRRKEHRPEVLEALVADLKVAGPDHVVITGDLTNIGLEEEFRTAATWLRQLGDQQHISLVPGNHDTYVSIPRSCSWDYWAQYMESDTGGKTLSQMLQLPTREPDGLFPTVRLRGPVAFIGVCSAQPTGLLHATGTVGTQQLAKLESILHTLANSTLCRVVLIHHPPTDDGLAPRRRLTDAAALRAVLARAGAELVLHGHIHKTTLTAIPGPDQSIPVIGVRSASYIGRRPHRQAQYHLYTITHLENERSARRFRITMTTRTYDTEHGCFRHIGEQLL